MPDDFQIAAERARQRMGQRIWDTMSTHERATVIYRELGALDAERAALRRGQYPVSSGGEG
jgi:hypothetical protein